VRTKTQLVNLTENLNAREGTYGSQSLIVQACPSVLARPRSGLMPNRPLPHARPEARQIVGKARGTMVSGLTEEEVVMGERSSCFVIAVE
jgi:hypothetical protein